MIKSGLGKKLLGTQPNIELENHFSGTPLPPFTNKTITDNKSLRKIKRLKNVNIQWMMTSSRHFLGRFIQWSNTRLDMDGSVLTALPIPSHCPNDVG